MTDATNPDDAYAHRLVELCKLLREGAISDLRTGFDWALVTPTGAGSKAAGAQRIVTADGKLLGELKVTLTYRVPGKGIHLELWEDDAGQTLNAADVFRSIYGFIVTEGAA